MNRGWIMLGLSVAVCWAGGAAAAVSDADKCEAAKLKVAGKYNFCRMKAYAKSVKTGDPPGYSKCDEKFADKWQKSEARFGVECPVTGDETAIKNEVTDDATAVAASIAGTPLPGCGDAVMNGAESCDGADLGGETCTSLGFTGGTLSCTAGCGFDVGACVCSSQAFPATGQVTCWNASGTVIPCAGTGHDGDNQAGAALAYVDNGDGTITDVNTGLMWEKLSDDLSIHDWDTTYTWTNASGVKIAALNGAVFAGYTDWRAPNAKELQSIVNYENSFPAVSPAFNTGCTPSCTVTTCSCTASSDYWTSTSTGAVPTSAWYLNFFLGNVINGGKVNAFRVRAVRGGL